MSDCIPEVQSGRRCGTCGEYSITAIESGECSSCSGETFFPLPDPVQHAADIERRLRAFRERHADLYAEADRVVAQIRASRRPRHWSEAND